MVEPSVEVIKIIGRASDNVGKFFTSSPKPNSSFHSYRKSYTINSLSNVFKLDSLETSLDSRFSIVVLLGLLVPVAITYSAWLNQSGRGMNLNGKYGTPFNAHHVAFYLFTPRLTCLRTCSMFRVPFMPLV